MPVAVSKSLSALKAEVVIRCGVEGGRVSEAHSMYTCHAWT